MLSEKARLIYRDKIAGKVIPYKKFQEARIKKDVSPKTMEVPTGENLFEKIKERAGKNIPARVTRMYVPVKKELPKTASNQE